MMGCPGVRRYTHLHGKHVLHPLDGRRIPIITDAELVDMTFGTGAALLAAFAEACSCFLKMHVASLSKQRACGAPALSPSLERSLAECHGAPRLCRRGEDHAGTRPQRFRDRQAP
jgi:hypothetical protein